jgi:hypothetical protein
VLPDWALRLVDRKFKDRRKHSNRYALNDGPAEDTGDWNSYGKHKTFPMSQLSLWMAEADRREVAQEKEVEGQGRISFKRDPTVIHAATLTASQKLRWLLFTKRQFGGIRRGKARPPTFIIGKQAGVTGLNHVCLSADHLQTLVWPESNSVKTLCFSYETCDWSWMILFLRICLTRPRFSVSVTAAVWMGEFEVTH